MREEPVDKADSGGFVPAPSGPRRGPGLSNLVKSEIAKWTPVIKAAGPTN